MNAFDIKLTETLKAVLGDPLAEKPRASESVAPSSEGDKRLMEAYLALQLRGRSGLDPLVNSSQPKVERVEADASSVPAIQKWAALEQEKRALHAALEKTTLKLAEARFSETEIRKAAEKAASKAVAAEASLAEYSATLAALEAEKSKHAQAVARIASLEVSLSRAVKHAAVEYERAGELAADLEGIEERNGVLESELRRVREQGIKNEKRASNLEAALLTFRDQAAKDRAGASEAACKLSAALRLSEAQRLNLAHELQKTRRSWEEQKQHLENEARSFEVSRSLLGHESQGRGPASQNPVILEEISAAAARLKEEIEGQAERNEITPACSRELRELAKQIGLFVAFAATEEAEEEDT